MLRTGARRTQASPVCDKCSASLATARLLRPACPAGYLVPTVTTTEPRHTRPPPSAPGPDPPLCCTHPPVSGPGGLAELFALPDMDVLSVPPPTVWFMSMIGQYLRLTRAELERALHDPGWAAAYAHELYDREDAAAVARVHETDKAWHALDFLLKRRGFPVDVVFGEADMPWPEAEDWGYGPPRLLTADRVRAAADALEDHAPDRLTDGVTPADLAAANVYPQTVWERGEEPDWVAAHWAGLAKYLRAAAREGDAMLLWIS